VDAEDLRLAVYRSFAETGRCPDADGLAAQLGQPAATIRDGLAELAAARHVVLDDAGTAIVMAHPFAATNLGFSVMGARTLWWGGCAWDAFAIPHLVDDVPSVLVATTCPACDEAHAWTVDRIRPPAGDQVAHFLVPVAQMWDDVLHTCGNQRIYCDEACVGDRPGDTFDLPTLWRLARGWYAGRLDRGYRRREPAAAAAYFESAGLSGLFWGLG
jgi:hypothetical protein